MNNFTHTPMLTLTEQAISFSDNTISGVVSAYNAWVKRRTEWHKSTPLIQTRPLSILYRNLIVTHSPLPTPTKMGSCEYTLFITYEHCDVVGAAEGTNQKDVSAAGFSAYGQKVKR